jgi:hypothetical protein
MKDTLIQQCLDILKSEDIKNTILKPFLSYILYELNPYIYLIIILFSVLFIMNLSTFIILITLIRSRQIK